MKLHLLAPSVIALGAAFIFTGGNTSEGYSLLGHNLSLNQRDFRVYNNFPGSGANNNQTPDAQFPGATGAVLAIWKGAIEWSSRTHGTGQGDPTQAGGLGSGGANFDPSFQGEANLVGQVGDNIASALTGASGGTLAFAEINGLGDWRMRFYTAWDWADGPSFIGGSQQDMQGVATHEYGHCLGLNHSTNTFATMAPTNAPGATGARSINSDDQAGVRAIYGVATGNKPVISSVNIAVFSQITITGTNFGPTNEVWFTRQDFTGNGAPLKMFSVPSANNGTEITVTVPSNARPGDILVRNINLGTAGGSLSNAFPFDTNSTACPPIATICSGFPNSTGQGGDILVLGSGNVATNDTILLASSLPVNQFGIFLYGQGTSPIQISNGILCLGGSAFYRLNIVQVDSLGTAQYFLDLTNLPPGGEISAAETWNFQLWHRENGGQSNFTAAKAYTFCN